MEPCDVGVQVLLPGWRQEYWGPWDKDPKGSGTRLEQGAMTQILRLSLYPLTSAALCTAGLTAVLRLPGRLQLAADPWAHEEDEGSNPRCTLRPCPTPLQPWCFS